MSEMGSIGPEARAGFPARDSAYLFRTLIVIPTARWHSFQLKSWNHAPRNSDSLPLSKENRRPPPIPPEVVNPVDEVGV